MRVLIHDEEREVRDGVTVGELLAQLQLDDAVCAVAVNREHVPRAEHARPLCEGDAVEILAPMAGG